MGKRLRSKMLRRIQADSALSALNLSPAFWTSQPGRLRDCFSLYQGCTVHLRRLDSDIVPQTST